MKYLVIVLLFFLTSCSKENWHCYIDGKDMWSISDSGNIGPANYGCSCKQIRDHAYLNWGYVDEDVMKSDFGCYFN